MHVERRHYYFIAGTVFNDQYKKQTIKLRPTTFIKLTQAAPIEFDLTALFYFNDKFWAGPMFRSGDAAGALIGLKFNRPVFIRLFIRLVVS